MDRQLFRDYIVELIGTFGFVFFASGLACVNVMTTTADASPGSLPVTIQQPGLVGVALGQALAWMALVAWAGPLTGGYLNPAVAVMRWVFGRLPTVRMAWLLGAQLVGAVVAGLVLQLVFDSGILRACRGGAPHLNPLAFGEANTASLLAGVGVEFLLTFFFVLAMFAHGDRSFALSSGAILAAAVLVAGPLTGAALNPARWFGPAFWDVVNKTSASTPGREAIIYVVGPIVGALAAAALARFNPDRSGVASA
jgi:aquaporin Z